LALEKRSQCIERYPNDIRILYAKVTEEQILILKQFLLPRYIIDLGDVHKVKMAVSGIFGEAYFTLIVV